MQKFTKFALAMIMGFFAIAANAEVKTLYSWESPEGTVIEQGGTIAYVNGDGDRLNYANGGYYTICLNGKKGNLADATPSANAGHMVITFNEALKAGDEIVMTAYYNKGEDKNVSAWLVFENGTALASDKVSSDIARGGSPEDITVVVPAEADGSKTLTLTRSEAGTNMFITKLVISGERTASTGWDGTVKTSLDSTTVTKLSDFNNLTITLPGAKSIVALGEEDAQYLALQNANGSELYGIWSTMYGGTYTIDGENITLNGFNALDGATTTIPAGTTKLYIEDYGTFVIDGKEDYLPTMEFAANIAGATEPFTLTSVENNGVAGNIVTSVEASEQGVSYQFTVTATGKVLTKGEGVPTLSLMENDSINFGAASILAYDSEQAYIRFMDRQENFFTTPGTYVLSIPEGTFVDAEGTPNAAATLKWVVIQGEDKTPFDIAAVNMNWMGETIAAGDSVQALSYMYTIDTDKTIAAGEGHIEFKDAQGQGIGVGSLIAEAKMITFYNFGENGYTTPGTYTLTIPAGAIVDAEGNPCNEFTATWTVKAQGEKTPFDIAAVNMNWMGETIAAGDSVQALSYMYTIDTDKTIAAGEGHIEFKDAQGQGIGVGSLIAEAKMITFYNFGENGYTTPGTYTLTIPAGAIVDAEGNPCNEFTATWTVKAQGEKTPFEIAAVSMNWMGETIAAGDSVQALSYMYTIDTDKTIAAGEGHIEFKDAQGQGIGVGSLNAEAKMITFYNFGENGYTTPGTYTLTIPAGAIVDAEGNPCKEFTATWTVKEQGEKTPFDIDGVNMMWKGEMIAAGDSVEALSYMYEIVTDKQLSAGNGHIEFFDAQGNGIGVGSLAGNYVQFMNFGQYGYTTAGTYTLVIPAGAVVDAEGNPNNEFTATWTVVPAEINKDAVENQIAAIDSLLSENMDKLGESYNTFVETLNTLKDALANATTQEDVDAIAAQLNQLYGEIQEAIAEATGINTVTVAGKANGKYVVNGKVVIVKNGKLFNIAGQLVK